MISSSKPLENVKSCHRYAVFRHVLMGAVALQDDVYLDLS